MGLVLGLCLGNGAFAQTGSSGPDSDWQDDGQATDPGLLLENLQKNLINKNTDNKTTENKNSENKKAGKTVTLDDLFEQLKRETDWKKAKRIEKEIWYRWTRSGSQTVDLLMEWAGIAVKNENWAVAFDLLDQVIVIAPQYAEGWNRRASLYYLRGQLGRSIHDIEQVLKLESRHFGAMAGMGSILQKLDKSIANDKRALAMWRNILEIYPANKNAQKSVIVLEEKLSGLAI